MDYFNENGNYTWVHSHGNFETGVFECEVATEISSFKDSNR